MAHALSPNLPMPDRRSRAVSLAIGGSVLAHVAIGWIVVASLIARPLPDEPEPLVVEIARPEPLPPPAPPQLKPDEPPPKPEEKPRVRPRPAPVVPEAAPVEALPVPPQPPSAEEGTVTALPQTVPATAPSPTRRFAVAYPARAEAREMAGTATVEVTVAAGGAVAAVRIVEETPRGYGFGDAAIDSVARWEFATAQPGTYRVTVRFRLD
ncbi:MAG: TonB family protein [Alphaproteobacteria bacterium]|nr:TonB family protein [Alphaproteobacteria bacterium]